MGDAHEAYGKLWAEQGVSLPLVGTDGDGIFQAGDDGVTPVGNVIIRADPDYEMSDEVAAAIEEAIVLAINTCGGFKSERPE